MSLSVLLGVISWFFWIWHQSLRPFVDLPLQTVCFMLFLGLGVYASQSTFRAFRKKEWQVFAIIFLSTIPFLRYALDAEIIGPVAFGGFDWHGYAASAFGLAKELSGQEFFYRGQNPVLVHLFIDRTVFASYLPTLILHEIGVSNLALAALASQYLAGLVLFLTLEQFFRTAFQLSKPTSVFLVFMLSISPYFHFLVSEAYMSQTWGMVFFFSGLTLILQKPIESKFYIKDYCFLVVLLMGLSLSYGHMLAPVLAFYGLLLLHRGFAPSVKIFAIVFIALTALSPLRQWYNFLNARLLGSIAAGPGMSSQHAESWLGLFFNSSFDKAPLALEIGVTLLFFVLAFKSFRHMNRTNKVAASCWPILLVLMLAAGVLMKIQNTPAMNYKFFKLVSFFLPLILLFFWLGLSKSFSRNAAWPMALTIIGLNLFNTIQFNSAIVSKGHRLEADSFKLIQSVDSQKSYTVFAPKQPDFDNDYFNRLFAGVFLLQNKVSYWNGNGFFPSSEETFDRALVLNLQATDRFRIKKSDGSEICYRRISPDIPEFETSQCTDTDPQLPI